MKVREVIRLLERDGWRQVRQTGSHRQFRHLEGLRAHGDPVPPPSAVATTVVVA